jgi:hypothetical protein
MPDKRKHRGSHPLDRELFSGKNIPTLCQAVGDYSLLLTKGYPEKSSLKLVGDRFSLTSRQRTAVMRCSCSDEQLDFRLRHRLCSEQISGREIIIDGYNLLITVESALSGAAIFKSRDSSFKDLAGLHGTYRKVEETIPSFELIGDFLRKCSIPRTVWVLDKPVSNSGKLKNLLEQLAKSHGWNWQVKLKNSPDNELKNTDLPIVSSDSAVLDKCSGWFNMAKELIENCITDAWLIDLSKK